MAVTTEEIINDYYDFQGDDPPSAPTDVDLRLANKTIEEILRRFKWGFARTTVTLSLVSKMASLASNFSQPYDLRYVQSGQGDDIKYGKIDSESEDDFSDAKYWITGDNETGYKLNSSIDTNNPLTFIYYRRHLPLSAMSDTTFIPFSEPVALGMYYRTRKIDNPDSDVSQELGDYERSVRQMRSWDQRLNGRKGRYQGAHEAYSYTFGE